MNENKVEETLKRRYFFAMSVVILYILFGVWMVIENPNSYMNEIHWTPLISVFLIFINNRWSDRILLFYYIFDFTKTLNYVVGRCRDNFPTNTLRESYYWLIDIPSFHWTLAFWILQISLIVYLITLEIKVYKVKN